MQKPILEPVPRSAYVLGEHKHWTECYQTQIIKNLIETIFVEINSRTNRLLLDVIKLFQLKLIYDFHFITLPTEI